MGPEIDEIVQSTCVRISEKRPILAQIVLAEKGNGKDFEQDYWPFVFSWHYQKKGMPAIPIRFCGLITSIKKL